MLSMARLLQDAPLGWLQDAEWSRSGFRWARKQSAQ